MRAENLAGRKFGHLSPVQIDHVGKNGHAYWECICDCGNKKVVRAGHLKAGNVTTCGCIPARKTHGDSGTRLHNIWNKMRARCSDKNDPLYGGRGIAVCDEWLDYQAFKKWAMSHGYRDDLSIDRINTNGNYEPSNCRWATAKDQANNTRRTRFITFNGETYSVSEWAHLLGIRQSTLSMRLNKYMWSADKALREEVRRWHSIQ